MRTVFFVTNFGGGVLFTVACIGNIILPFCWPSEATPYSFLGGILFLLPSTVYTLSEWRAFRKQDGRLERRLGFVCLGLAAVILISLVGHSLEAVQKGLFWANDIHSLFVLIFAYFAFCGYVRVRRLSAT